MINAANVVYSLYVFTLPIGPIWALHTFYVVSCAIMLALCLRQRRTSGGRPVDSLGMLSVISVRGVRPGRSVGGPATAKGSAMPATLEDLLGIDEPIVLGPFGGASSVELTAVVSEPAGSARTVCTATRPSASTRRSPSLRAATSRPFAVNLWLPTGDEVAPGEVDLATVPRGSGTPVRGARVPAPSPPPRSFPASTPS